MTKSRKGDIAAMVSPPVELEELGCLHLDYYMAGEIQLDVFMTNTHHRYQKERLCSLVSDRTESYVGWNSTDIMLPPGDYRLLFEAAILKTADARVYLDNITLYSENCTAIEVIEYEGGSGIPLSTKRRRPLCQYCTRRLDTIHAVLYYVLGLVVETLLLIAEYLPTTEMMTTVGPTMDENATTSIYDISTSTTESFNLTTVTYYEYVHEAFAHWQCPSNATECKTCANSFSGIEGNISCAIAPFM